MSGSTNLLGKRELRDDLETKPILKRHKENSEKKETTKGFASKKTLYVSNLSRQTGILDIIDFFKDVGHVVRVRRTVDREGRRMFTAFVEFASLAEANKALEMKNGGYLLGNSITLVGSLALESALYPPPPKFLIDHKVWNEDQLLRETLLIKEEEAVEGLDETHDYVEAVEVRKRTLLVAHLSPQTKVEHIIDFFKVVGEVVSVRLIVNHEGKNVGYGFVEFAYACEANKALEEKNGEYLHDHKIFLDVAKTAPYPLRPNHNLAEKLWYEDYLLRESLLRKEDETVEGLDETPHSVEAVALRKRTLYVFHLSRKTKISDIIDFFKDVGEVVHVRLMVNNQGKHLERCFVEFASANEAKKALEKKDGECLHDREVFLGMAKTRRFPTEYKYCIDHKFRYEDYLRRENLLIEEDETVEGLDETPDFVAEVAIRKKTLFIANLSPLTKLKHIVDFFKDVAQVVRVQLSVNEEGHSLGCGYVEFASTNIAKKVLKKEDRRLLQRRIYLDVVEIAPYPLRPKYNVAEKLWYEDYLREEGDLIEEEDLKTKKSMRLFCGKKTIFNDD